jgi:GT2 family glycosyltransferase
MISASFVIVNYNRKNELLLTIQKTQELIKDYEGVFEIVIVDNGSTDGSAEAVASAFPDVVLIAQKVNTGAPAWNVGFEKAKGDYFIILDDDSHIETGLDKALFYINANSKIGVLALNILTGPYTSEGWKMQEGKNIIGFIGCGAIFRKETYRKIGGYAEWIFLYVNEWDLGIRCANAGYEVQYFKDCKVTHRTSSLHRTTKRLDVLVTKHELGIIYKHFPKQRWKYITRVSINNFKKLMKGLELKRVWYQLLGISQFLKMRSSLSYTPVSIEVQKLYIQSFPTTRDSAFEFILKRFR